MKTVAALALLLAAAVMTLPAVVGAESFVLERGKMARGLPPLVPDFTDTETLTHFVPVAQGRLWGNPDFPIVLVRGRGESDPLFVLIILDARNGKETWSIVEDPMILVSVRVREELEAETYVDEGFVVRGAPSGAFIEVEGATLNDLSGLLEAGYTSATSRQNM